MLGPRAQEVLRPWLERDAGVVLLRAGGDLGLELPAAPPARPSAEAGGGREPRVLKLRPGLKYTRHSYRVAVQRACKRAGIPAWSPRQLRHTRATMIRQAYGLEAAKAVLGHADTKITEIYAERDLELAMQVMRESVQSATLTVSGVLGLIGPSRIESGRGSETPFTANH